MCIGLCSPVKAPAGFVVLEADLPAEAYRQLTALDLSRFSHGPVHYDLGRGRWRAELDEASPPAANPPRP